MRFRGLDLNLLVALDALLDERSVTAAGRKLHLSQSAMSSALGRLRRHFADPLLITVGRHMELTPYGAKLAGAVRAILLQIDASLKAPAAFDPRSSSRRFTIAASDYAVNVLLLEMQRRCAVAAPGISLEILPVHEDTLTALHRGAIDLLILPDGYRLESCPAEILFRDRLVCVTAKENRTVPEALTLAAFKAADHVVFQTEPGTSSPLTLGCAGATGSSRRLNSRYRTIHCCRWRSSARIGWRPFRRAWPDCTRTRSPSGFSSPCFPCRRWSRSCNGTWRTRTTSACSGSGGLLTGLPTN